jgi:hypothetical protein
MEEDLRIFRTSTNITAELNAVTLSASDDCFVLRLEICKKKYIAVNYTARKQNNFLLILYVSVLTATIPELSIV